MLLSGLPWKEWGMEFFAQKWVWAVVYFVFACILALLKDLHALALPSLMGNIFIISVSIIVIMYDSIAYLPSPPSSCNT